MDPLILSVIDASDYCVTIDVNHPVAGEDLVFDLDPVDAS
jgi:FKBP-type peptidyl-prolyl cis-trans isomerase 2